MSASLAKQLKHAVHQCYTPGDSKRADKFNAAIETGWKIYSLSSRRDMLDLTKDLAKYIKQEYPEVRKAYQISPEMLQEYLNTKSSTCVDTTLGKIQSRLGKLEKICMHTYAGSTFIWNAASLSRPISTKNDAFKKDKPIPLEVTKEIIGELSKRKSEVANAVILSAYVGLRANEAVHLKVKDVHLSGGQYGFGYVEIAKGGKGGAKGGRGRTVPIINEEAQQAVSACIKGKPAHEYIAARIDGRKMTPDNVQQILRNCMDTLYGKKYIGNRNHAMRKQWAQNYYDILRSKGYSKKETIALVNQHLGHGAKRPDIIRAYVAKIY